MKTFEELVDEYRRLLLAQASMRGGGYQDRRRSFRKVEMARQALATEYGRVKMLLAAYRPEYSARRILGKHKDGGGEATVELTA